MGGPQGQTGQVRKISPPPGFDPRTAQPTASRYTDSATWPRNGEDKHANIYTIHCQKIGSAYFCVKFIVIYAEWIG
jgi:hypothetical protein